MQDLENNTLSVYVLCHAQPWTGAAKSRRHEDKGPGKLRNRAAPAASVAVLGARGGVGGGWRAAGDRLATVFQL